MKYVTSVQEQETMKRTKTVKAGYGEKVRKFSGGGLHRLKHNAHIGIIPKQKSH
jgi:hypothetical protein